jgi:hypothetical protein
MSAVDELRRTFAPLDPAAGEQYAPDRPALAAILAQSREPRTHRIRWALVAATAAAAVVAIVVVQQRTPPPVLAATPKLLAYSMGSGTENGRAELDRIAARAAALPAPAPSDLPEHLKIQSWSLFTRVDGRQVTSKVVPVDTESWRAPDESGRLITDGEVTTFPPGGFTRMWDGRPPAAATAWLQIGHPAANGPAETLIAVTDLARERVLTPAERAATLRVVAALPALTYRGTVIDRAGRAGEAFAIDSNYSGLPTRYTLIVDPVDGRLLGFEQMLTTTAGLLRVAVPSVIGYDAYLVADHAAMLPR